MWPGLSFLPRFGAIKSGYAIQGSQSEQKPTKSQQALIKLPLSELSKTLRFNALRADRAMC